MDRAVKIVIEGKSSRMDSFVRRSRELPQLSEDSQAADSARTTGMPRYHLARRRGTTSRRRAIFLPAPGRSVARSSHTRLYRHSRPESTT